MRHILEYNPNEGYQSLIDKIFTHALCNHEFSVKYAEELKGLRKCHINDYFSIVFPTPVTPKSYVITEENKLDKGALVRADIDGKNLTIKGINDPKGYLNGLMIEQGLGSPHNYRALLEKVADEIKGDILIDCGAAEGNFSLEFVTNFKEVYLIESDPNWNDSLRNTFSCYGNVSILNGTLSEKNDLITMLEDVPKDQKVLIKMDLEGAEAKVLLANKELLNNPNINFLICLYHNQTDEQVITTIAKTFNRDFVLSDGYMLFPNSISYPPFFRHGLIYI